MTELGDLLAAAGYQSGDVLLVDSLGNNKTGSSTTSNTSYTTLQPNTGYIDIGENVPQSGLMVRFVCLTMVSAGGATGTIVPDVFDAATDSETRLTELEVTTSSTSAETVDSGWVTPTSITPNQLFRTETSGKIDDGTETLTVWQPNIMVGVRL